MGILKNKKMLIFIILFIVLNVLCTYFTTTHTFNQNIVTFKRTPIMEISSILGNTSIVVLLFSLGTLFIKKERGLCWYMIIITFLLNLMVFCIGYFTKNYKTMFSLHNFTLFRNPDAGFAGQVVLNALKELFVLFKVVCFTPFVILVAYFAVYNRKFKHEKTGISVISNFIMILSSIIVSILTVTFFQAKVNNNWEYRTEVPQYGCQTCGMYNYFFAELFYGVDYSENYVKDDIEVINGKLKEFSKANKSEYVNLIDGKTYKSIDQGSPLKGKNLMIIQAESLQNFVIDFKYTDKEGNEQYLVPQIRDLIYGEATKNNVFYFNNCHTVVGLGNTSDAEFAVNTGLYPLGDATIAWEVYDKYIELNKVSTIPQNLRENEEYKCFSYNPTLENFYAHKFVHENLYYFDLYRGIETYRKEYPQNLEENKKRYLLKNWISDKYMLEYSMDKAKSEALDTGKKFYTFVETISPHLPFDDISKYYPEGTVYEKLKYPDGLSDQFINYLNQNHYNDHVIREFIDDANSNLDNTVFIIYGDHGNTLTKDYYECLFGRMTELEYRKYILNIPVIVYDPSGDLAKYCNDKSLDMDYVLHRTLSQIDIYATIYSLFGFTKDTYLYGVNMFSMEPSYSIDPKNLDIITDDFMYSLKNKEFELFNENYSEKKMLEVVDKLKELKLYNDYYLSYILDNAKLRDHKKDDYTDSFID